MPDVLYIYALKLTLSESPQYQQAASIQKIILYKAREMASIKWSQKSRESQCLDLDFMDT